MVERLFRQDTAIYVKYLHMSIDNARLEKEFSRFGRIISARVVTDSGRSKGYGFITFGSREAANNAIKEMNGFKLEGKRLYVSLADRQKPPMEMGQFFPAGSVRGYYNPNLEPTTSTAQSSFIRCSRANSPEPPIETLSHIELIERQLMEHKIIQQRRVDPNQQRTREQINLNQRMPIPHLRLPQEDQFIETGPQNQPQSNQAITLEELHQLLERQTEVVSSPEGSLTSQFSLPPLPQPQFNFPQLPAIPRIIFPQQGNQQRQTQYDQRSNQFQYPHQFLFPSHPPAIPQQAPPPPPPPHGQFAVPPYFTSPYEGPSRMYFMGPAYNNPWNMPLPQISAAPRNDPTYTPDMPVNSVRPNISGPVRQPVSTISGFPPIRPSTSVRYSTFTSGLPSTSAPVRPSVATRPATYAQVCASTYGQVCASTYPQVRSSTYAEVCASNSRCTTQRRAGSKAIPKDKWPRRDQVLTEEKLNAAPHYKRKNMIKEQLFPLVQFMFPYIAKRIINALLELPNDELLHMLQHEPCLQKRITEAAKRFRQQQIQNAALITAAASQSKH